MTYYHPYLGYVSIVRTVGDDVLVRLNSGFRYWTMRHWLRRP